MLRNTATLELFIVEFLVCGPIAAIRAMLASGKLPPPANDARCKECSLNEICHPQAMASTDGQKALAAGLFEVEE